MRQGCSVEGGKKATEISAPGETDIHGDKTQGQGK